jgi:hypothetical protein
MTQYQAKRFFIPEVVQTSQMDCGPASLKAVLEGFGISASYGRLREACQTSVDGTSIDTLEELLMQLGLGAEQIMLPADYVLLPEAEALPAIIVVRLPNGLTHFVVVWSCHANWVQVMDPGAGRQWKTRRRFLNELFIHHFPVPAVAWRDWAGSSGFLSPLHRRLRDLRVIDHRQSRWLESEPLKAVSLVSYFASVRLFISISVGRFADPCPLAAECTAGSRLHRSQLSRQNSPAPRNAHQ